MTLKALTLLLLGFIATSSNAQIYGFNPVPAGEPFKDVCVVDNVPPVMSQGTLGICYAAAAAIILTAENCRWLKEDCTKITKDKVFSPVGIYKYGMPERNSTIGGNTANVLQEIAYEVGLGPAHDCVDVDKLTSKVGGWQLSQKHLDMWNDIESMFNRWQKSAVLIDQACSECIDAFIHTTASDDIKRLHNYLNLEKTDKEIVSAFSEDRFPIFLSKLIVPKICYRLSRAVLFEPMNKVKVDIYPKEKKSDRKLFGVN